MTTPIAWVVIRILLRDQRIPLYSTQKANKKCYTLTKSLDNLIMKEFLGEGDPGKNEKEMGEVVAQVIIHNCGNSRQLWLKTAVEFCTAEEKKI